jgi:signal transduction histidine kinase
MTALRQAALLTILFLLIIIIAGISSVLLIKKEILYNVDQELSINHQKISQQIDLSDLDSLQLSSDALIKVGYKTNTGRSFGIKDRSLYKRKGFFNASFDSNGDEDEWRVFNAPTKNGNLAVAINMEQRLEVLEIVGKLFLIIGALSTLTALIVGLLIGLKNQRRFDKINQTLDKIAAGDLKARVEALTIKDDLDQVAFHIDSTTQRLEKLVEQTRNLSANIAHDLKTPLARVRAKLENILLVEDADLIEAAVLETLDQTDQLIATFEAILRIAHLNSGQYRERFKQYSLSEIVNETAEIYQAVVEDKQHQLMIDIDSNFQLMGDRELLIQLIANLLENALRHTKDGSSILLKCSDNLLIVADNGPGIETSMREKVLEPMYRLEQSRNRPGNGLGLSMVATIAQLHNAKLTLSDSAPSLFNGAYELPDENGKSSQVLQAGLTVSIAFMAINER